MPAQLVAIAVLAAGCAGPEHRAIIGTWKSDAARTLASMREVVDVPQQVRAAFENDYHGHLVVEYRADTVRAYFDDGNYDSGYQPYEVVEVTDDYVVTREWNEVLAQFSDSTTYLDGECIYGVSAEYQYREYFCPLAN
ncbi:MAG TPA: hypothetical protein VJA26_10540 [Gammaproteobacteria bacterium]|nr:hypothetical protein [Gammaproteobacteria bacterium]